MAYKLADGQPLWPKPAEIQGWVHDIVQHPAGIIILPSHPRRTRRRQCAHVNGVVQTGLNVARYADGTTIAEKPLRMRGTSGRPSSPVDRRCSPSTPSRARS